MTGAPRSLWTGMADLSPAVKAAQAGDEEAFRLLYRSIHPRLLRYLRVLVRGDAEDVASETWLQVARDLRSFDGDGDKFRGWVATIARHRAMDHLRREQRRPPADLPAELLVELAADEDTAGQALESLTTDAALAMISSLPRDQAEAVLLRVVMGLDAESAGKVLGKRAGAVRTAAYRGLRRLAERLHELQASPPDERTVHVDAAAQTREISVERVTQTRASTLKDMR